MKTLQTLERLEELRSEIKRLTPYEENWTGDESVGIFEGEIVNFEDKIGELEDLREELKQLEKEILNG